MSSPRFLRFRRSLTRLLDIERRLDDLAINQGRLLAVQHDQLNSTQLTDFEFKVFSQWGEDGILQFLTRNLKICNRTFIEFGVEDFYESNCRFLLMKDCWNGYVIDGSAENMERLRNSDFFWRYPLNAKTAFITKENVDNLLRESGFHKEIGILSVDIDGVDYFVLEALSEWRPSIIVVEYNGIFGSERPVSVPYISDFQRKKQHYSNLYYGANLPAFMHLLQPRGYALVGVNSVGSNAFFVRRDLLNERVHECAMIDCYRTSCFREGRNESGELSFVSGNARRGIISQMPLVDVTTGQSLFVRDL